MEVAPPAAPSWSPTRSTSSIARRAAGGVPWVLLAVASQRLLGFATNLVLARLLVPADFGLVSFAMVIIGASNILEDFGVPAAIIYGGRDARTVGGTALTINIAAATLLFLAIALASPLLASLGGHEEISSVVTILALGIVISSLGSVQNALLVRELAFRRKFLPDVVPVVASALVSILFAVLGFGVWSLVAGNLVKTSLTTLLLWYLSAIRPRPEFKLAIGIELLKYGRHVSLASILSFVVINVDYFIIGQTLGMTALGIYTMAFSIANLPLNALSQQVIIVTFPAYSRLKQNTEALFSMFEDVFSIICFVSIPLAVAIFICVPAYAPVVLGSKWAEIADPLRPLVVYGVLRSLTIQFGPVYKALGRPDIVWKLAAVRLVILVPLILWAVGYGIGGVAIVQVVVMALFFPIGMALVPRLMGIPVWRLWRLVAPQFGGAGVVALLLTSISAVPFLSAVSATLPGPLVMTVLAGAGYALVVVALNPRVVALGRAGLASLQRVRWRA